MTLKRFLKKNRYHFYIRIPHLLQTLQASMSCAAVSEGYVAQVRILTRFLRQIHHTIHQLEKDIATVLNTYPEAAWWRSLPGAHGTLTAARMLT